VNKSSNPTLSHIEIIGSSASEYKTTKYLSSVGSTAVNPDCIIVHKENAKNQALVNSFTASHQGNQPLAR